MIQPYWNKANTSLIDIPCSCTIKKKHGWGKKQSQHLQINPSFVSLFLKVFTDVYDKSNAAGIVGGEQSRISTLDICVYIAVIILTQSWCPLTFYWTLFNKLTVLWSDSCWRLKKEYRLYKWFISFFFIPWQNVTMDFCWGQIIQQIMTQQLLEIAGLQWSLSRPRC